jgi:hypothetical protein
LRSPRSSCRSVTDWLQNAAIDDVDISTTIEHRPSIVPVYAAGWFAIAGAFIVNGAIREAVYAERLGSLAAHQVSCFTVLPLVAGATYGLERLRPLDSPQQALAIGAAWAAGAMSFDFVVGHFVNGTSWVDLLREYDVTQGRLWGLAVLAVAAMPLLVHRWMRRAR